MTLKEFNIIENQLINEYAGYFDKKELITQFPSKISNIKNSQSNFDSQISKLSDEIKNFSDVNNNLNFLKNYFEK